MTERRNLLQESLAAIERLQARLASVEAERHEPIAVVGMSCRVPGGVRQPQELWRLLAEGRDAVSQVPPDRWDVDAFFDPDPKAQGKAYTKAGGFVDELDLFEPSFFGISPREATSLDPQQRLLLEGAWHALESAGISPDSLDGTCSGVFVGITSIDYAQRIDINDPARSDMYVATGVALNAAAGRISFAFGLRGPCMAIDTACSSSLVAVHAACQSLRTRESELAIVGGVNLILDPKPFVLLSKFSMLSPDGRCKAFDASANGFVRGEGCSVIVLKRLRDAQAASDNVLAVICGSAINQDGRSSGLTVPNGIAQQEVVRAALASARLRPADVSYVEAHGTGTSLGDPIEAEALGIAYGEGRDPRQPLEIGSIKSNIGHLEAASGITSLIKVVLALQNRQLPASLHFREPSPAIDWDRLPVRVSAKLHDWEPAGGARRAGVSAFGFSGMNAHVILEDAPAVAAADAGTPRSHELLVLSAKTAPALSALASRYAEHLVAHPQQRLADVCHTAAAGRAALSQRLALVADSRESLVAQLRSATTGSGPAFCGRAPQATRRRVAFLFTGQGSQYAGMGRDLYAAEPVFRAVIDRCAAVLDPLLPRPLTTLMFGEADGLLDQTGCTQPALYALEIALATMWQHWGVEPAVVLGHSVGEYAAAALAGMFGIEDGARLIAERARLMQALPAGGAMLAVQGRDAADVALVEREVATMAERVSIAAWNGPTSVVIAGVAADIDAIAERLAAAGIRTQPLVVSHAFHSPLMAPMLHAFERFATDINYREPQLAWISTLDGQRFDWSRWRGQMARYWTEHVRQAVRFTSALRELGVENCEMYLEIGPHPILTGMGQSWAEASQPIKWLASLHRKRPAWEQVLISAGEMFVEDIALNWQAMDAQRGCRTLPLPTYPFQRQRFWMEATNPRRASTGPTVHDLLGSRLSTPGVAARFERLLSQNDPAWLQDHRIGGEAVMPLTAYLEIALAAARQMQGQTCDTLHTVEVDEPLPLRSGEERLLQTVVDKPDVTGMLCVRIFSRDASREDASWVQHASAWFGNDRPTAGVPQSTALDEARARCGDALEVGPFYDKLRGLGVDFGPQFAAMRSAWVGCGEAVVEVESDAALSADGERFAFHPALLDACFHASAVAMDSLPGADDGRMYLPIGVDRVDWYTRPNGRLTSHARIREPQVRSDMLVIDIQIDDARSAAVTRLEGLRCRRASRDMLRQRADAQAAEWLYAITWKPQPLPAGDGERALQGRWVVYDEGHGRGERLAAEIVRRGGSAVRVLAGHGDSGAGAIRVDPGSAADHAHVLVSEGPALAGVVMLWPLALPALDDTRMPSTAQRLGTDAALLVLQALAASGRPAPVWIVTAGAESVDGTETPRIEQAPVAGLARVAVLEHPELRVTHVDLDPQTSPTSSGDARALADELGAATSASGAGGHESRVAVRKGLRHVARLARLARRHKHPTDESPTRLHIQERGTLENLAIVPGQRRAPGPTEIEIRVRASGLNFRDVLSALGLYPVEIKHLGSDCAGEIVALGSEVCGFKVGDRVVAMVEGAFASHATTRWEFVAPLPAGLDFELGAAIPTAYLTADITLNQIAHMKKGDRVLIHSGAGGVGMAAIALAHRVGAEIFTTAGSPDKRAVLVRLGVHHVLDSRSPSFADEVMRITGGAGVNIVLNSLTGAMLDRSFEVLARDGIFLEIGKRNLWTHERATALGRNIRYHIVDCNDNARETPELVGRIFSRVLREIEAGLLPVLPCTTFPFERAPDAFRHMAQARHIGRVVFRHRVVHAPPAQVVRPDATYLVTGGLKGLGLLAARWLAGEGARYLLLAGRSAPDATAQQEIDKLHSEGVSVTTVATDVGNAAGIDAVMQALARGAAPLGGVLHGAAVLDDGVLVRQTPDRFAAVMIPKADGAWRLHRALERAGLKPDFFVLYSSMSAVLGSPGQGNYVAANAFLDALARHRVLHDRAASSIAWGVWKEIGMAARGTTVERAASMGLQSLLPAQGLHALNLVLREGFEHVAVALIDWDQSLRQMGDGAPPPLLEDLVAQARSGGGGAARARVQSVDYVTLPADERLARLRALVRGELATVLALPDGGRSIVDDQPFSSFGLDSLTSLELRNRLQAAAGQALAATATFEHSTVAALATHVASLFRDAPAAVDDPSREEVTL